MTTGLGAGGGSLTGPPLALRSGLLTTWQPWQLSSALCFEANNLMSL